VAHDSEIFLSPWPASPSSSSLSLPLSNVSNCTRSPRRASPIFMPSYFIRASPHSRFVLGQHRNHVRKVFLRAGINKIHLASLQSSILLEILKLKKSGKSEREEFNVVRMEIEASLTIRDQERELASAEGEPRLDYDHINSNCSNNNRDESNAACLFFCFRRSLSNKDLDVANCRKLETRRKRTSNLPLCIANLEWTDVQ